MTTIKYNTGYDHILIWREEWGVESQKILHIFKDGQALVHDEYHASLGLEIIQVRVKQGTTTITTVDFRECEKADVLLHIVAFGGTTLRFEYIYYYSSLQSPYVVDTYTETTLIINQKTIVNTDVVPRCTGQVVQIDDNTTLFTPPTINVLSANINQTLIWGYKGAESYDFSIRINVNDVITTLSTRNENYGTNNTKTRWFYTTISKTNASKIANGGVLEILDADNNVIWRGGRVFELGNVNNAANDVLQCQFNNFSTNNTNPFILVGIIEDDADFETADLNSDRYRVGDTYEGVKLCNDTIITHTINIPNLTMYDIWLYTALLANCPRYILTNHTLNFQNEQCIYYVKKWNVKQPTERDNGVLTITLQRYGNY